MTKLNKKKLFIANKYITVQKEYVNKQIILYNNKMCKV